MLKTDLVAELRTLTDRARTTLAERVDPLPLDRLNQRPADGGWTPLEVLEHVNRYMAIYLPRFERAFRQAAITDDPGFTPGWLGNKLAESMLPQDGAVKNKMRTFRSKNPRGTELDRSVIATFRADLDRLGKLLVFIPDRSLEGKVKTTLPLIRIKLGDALRFLIYHTERHRVQLERTVAEVAPPR
jgi:uncharacterized damage-inducible protein DinB